MPSRNINSELPEKSPGKILLAKLNFPDVTAYYRSMANAHLSSDIHDSSKTPSGGRESWGELFEPLQKAIPFAQALVVTTMPRGGLQIAQPGDVPDALFRGYSRDFHSEDRLTWQAIIRQSPLRGVDAWPKNEFKEGRYFTGFLQTHGLDHAAAAPLRSPILDGYPGTLHVYRAAEQGEFTDAELEKLAEFAIQIDAAADKMRAKRRSNSSAHVDSWSYLPSSRLFIFDGELRPQLPSADPSILDARIRQEMLERARHQFDAKNGQAVASERLQILDSHGDLWNFRVVTRLSYPAIGDGSFVFFCHLPDCPEWAAIRSSDFQADSELVQLVPALRFMQKEFHRKPLLEEVAAKVGFSLFHFHRRFTELLGITPKNLLLECQVHEAKRLLLERKKNLTEISADCGFSHQSHFTSRFKQATGFTPARWRRRTEKRFL